VPGLGFQRGLGEDLVVAPYASAMALIIAPLEACRNLERLQSEGAEGRFGFYEALDFTPTRVPPRKTHGVVRSYLAHHQGMTLLGLAYRLLDRPMQRRLDLYPFFKAAELLLQERVAKDTFVLYPHELEASRTTESTIVEPTFRIFKNP